MQFNDEHEMFRRSIRRFVEEEINPHVDEWEEAGIWPAHEVLKKMGDWVITGRKLYITNGAQADWVCLLARTSDEGGFRGMSLIIVPTDTPGFGVSRTLKKLGNWSSDTAELILDGVRVPKANTIGPEGMGFILQMQQFQRERLVGAITSYAGMEKTVRDAIAYTQQRSTFGQPL